MIINLPDTTTREINNRLIQERDEGGAVALGRVLTLIIDAGDRDPEEAIAAANEASHENPCRVIVLTEAEGRGSVLDAQIRLGGDAGASEVIVLRHCVGKGAHIDTLVLPLLLPDAPIVAWWPYRAPENPSLHPIGHLARRRITDSTECADPRATLERLAEAYTDGDTDLAWTRATLWRGLIAATLDQPPFESVTQATVSGESTHPSVDLIAAWLRHGLKCPVTVERIPDAPALTMVRLDRKSGPIIFDRPDGKVVALSQPDRPVHRIPLPIRSLRECLAEELRRLDADELYGEILCKELRKAEA